MSSIEAIPGSNENVSDAISEHLGSSPNIRETNGSLNFTCYMLVSYI